MPDIPKCARREAEIALTGAPVSTPRSAGLPLISARTQEVILLRTLERQGLELRILQGRLGPLRARAGDRAGQKQKGASRDQRTG